MTINYQNFGVAKETDPRPCLGISKLQGNMFVVAYAYMVNPDYSTHAVTIYSMDHTREDMLYDFDYRMAVQIDADAETVQKVRQKSVLDHIAKGEGLDVSDFAWRGVKPGDTVRVVSGRKYAYGTEITVADAYTFANCYNRTLAAYITGINGEKVDLKNCEIVSFGNGTLPQVGVGDTIMVTKDIINPVSNEIRFRAGTTVEVAGFEINDYGGKRREYYIGTLGEKIFKPFARRV